MEYTPNFATRLFLRSFFHTLPSRADALVPGRGPEIVRRVRKVYPQVVDANRNVVIDPLSYGHLITAAVILAAYRELMTEASDEARVIAALQDTYRQYIKRPVKLAFRAALAVTRDPVKLADKIWSSNLLANGVYGPAFTFETERTPDQYRFDIKRCFFFEFFKAQGLPHVTQVLCDWDNNWVEELNTSKRGVRAAFPSRYSTGGSICRFTVDRVRPEEPT